jgi:hypothetical protein
LVCPPGNKGYVRRDKQGLQSDAWVGPLADRRTKAKTVVKKGEGDRGHPKRPQRSAMAVIQADLFERGPRTPDGFKYRPQVLTESEQRRLLDEFAQLDFNEFQFRGFLGKRRIVSFGWRYDFNGGGLQKTDGLPSSLLPVREMAAAFSGRPAADFQQASVIEYLPGSAIGSHRDKSVFGDAVGILAVVSLYLLAAAKDRQRLGKSFYRGRAAVRLPC